MHAARQAADGAWGAMAPAERVRLLNRVALTLIAHEEKSWPRWKRATPASQCARPGPTRSAVARYFEFYAGAVDKLHGQTIPYNPGYTRC
ncbi:aldehyde dehydrogenase family protein [Cupriavidus basilensis]